MDGDKYTFKGRLFGGFDRQSVMDYAEKTASEMNELKEENKSLAEQIQKMVDDHNAKLAEMNDIMNAQLEEVRESCRREIEDEKAKCRAMADGEAEKRRAAERVKVDQIEEMGRIVDGLREKYDGVRSDMDVTAAHVRSELGRVADELTLLSTVLASSGGQMDELVKSIENDKKALSGAPSIKIGPEK